MDDNLEALASDPQTEQVELQRLARDYPNLRPLIAMNPAAYPELLQWMAQLNDPAVNLALQQRRAAEEAANGSPQRVSVLQRGARPADTGAIPVQQGAPQQSAAGDTWAGTGTTEEGATAQQAPVQAAGAPAWARATAPVDSDLVSPAPQAATADRRPGLIMAWAAVAVVLVVALVLLAWAIGRQRGSSEADQTPPPVATQPEDTSEDTGDGEVGQDDQQAPEADEPEDTIRFPAPTTALKVGQIVSPSGNIVCALNDQGAQCTILAYGFQDPSLATCQAQPLTLETTDGLATIGCTTTPVSGNGATTLSYGDYATNGRGACLSLETGVTCWNIVNGSSFAVAREGFLVGDQGPLNQGGFPWE